VANPQLDQNFKNHARLVPMFHFGVFIPLLVAFLWTAFRLFQAPSADLAIVLLVVVALILMALSLRVQVLTVQDRVIRLEMKLRLRSLMSGDQSEHVDRLGVKQMVALRFASDAELPALVADVATGKVTLPKEIKQRIADWQADHLRA
jgi:hypothetical protein